MRLSCPKNAQILPSWCMHNARYRPKSNFYRLFKRASINCFFRFVRFWSSRLLQVLAILVFYIGEKGKHNNFWYPMANRDDTTLKISFVTQMYVELGQYYPYSQRVAVVFSAFWGCVFITWQDISLWFLPFNADPTSNVCKLLFRGQYSWGLGDLLIKLTQHSITMAVNSNWVNYIYPIFYSYTIFKVKTQ